MDLKKGNQKSSTTTSSPSSSSTMLDCVSVCDSPPHPAPNSSPVVVDFLTSTCVSSFPVFPRSLPRRSRKFSEENGNTLNLNFSKHPPAHTDSHTQKAENPTQPSRRRHRPSWCWFLLLARKDAARRHVFRSRLSVVRARVFFFEEVMFVLLALFTIGENLLLTTTTPRRRRKTRCFSVEAFCFCGLFLFLSYTLANDGGGGGKCRENSRSSILSLASHSQLVE